MIKAITLITRNYANSSKESTQQILNNNKHLYIISILWHTFLNVALEIGEHHACKYLNKIVVYINNKEIFDEDIFFYFFRETSLSVLTVMAFNIIIG